MRTIQATAFAKVNLTLDVLRRLPDGFHEMCMVMQRIDLRDELSLTLGTGGPDHAKTNLPYLPEDDRNLALRAAQAFFREAGEDPGGIALNMKKRIPVCAGLGGGSADAAAVLLALDRAYPGRYTGGRLHELANSLGSDVPFCMQGGTALATGRGDVLRPLPKLLSCFCVLVKPRFSLSTKAMFSKLDCGKLKCHPDTGGVVEALKRNDLRGVSRRMYNIFEDLVGPRGRELAELKARLMDQGALGAVMSGSGPTVFGLFEEEQRAREAARTFKRQYRDVFCVRTL